MESSWLDQGKEGCGPSRFCNQDSLKIHCICRETTRMLMELNYTHIHFLQFLLNRENTQKYPLYVTLLFYQPTQVTIVMSLLRIPAAPHTFDYLSHASQSVTSHVNLLPYKWSVLYHHMGTEAQWSCGSCSCTTSTFYYSNVENTTELTQQHYSKTTS